MMTSSIHFPSDNLPQDAYEIILGACEHGNIAMDEVSLLAELQRDAMALIGTKRRKLGRRVVNDPLVGEAKP